MTDRPLRFAMVTTFYPPYNFGGDGIFVQRLSHELARRGHQVEVIHSIDAYRALSPSVPKGEYASTPGVRVHGLHHRHSTLAALAAHQSGQPLLDAARLRELLSRDFDVIHYHNISLAGGPGILSYGRGIKLYTMHEYWLVCPTHLLLKFNRGICVKRSCLACTLVHKRPPQWWRYTGLLKRALRHIDTFIAPCRFTQALHAELEVAAPIVHLPYFIPEAAVAVSDEDIAPAQPDGSPYFLYVGRLEKIKGVQTLIPLFRRHPRARLLIAGSGGYETELRRLAEGSENIVFLGFQSGSRLRQLYRDALALLLPSIWYEVFPQVGLEAMQQGTPIIVRDLGGMRELVEESDAGFLFDSDAQLLSAMERLLDDPSERQRLGAAGRAAYQRHWTVDVYMQRYLSLIESLATRHSPVAS